VNSVDIDLPQGTPPPTDIILDPVKNKLVLTPQDQILWNGTAINKGQLVETLRQTTTMAPEPELQFEPEALASYDLSADVLRIIKQSGVTKFGFVGNEKYRVFGKAE
jgi:biopolymer transport protein ExbD